MANSADPDQLASSTDLDIHCLQRQDVSGFSTTRVKTRYRIVKYKVEGRKSKWYTFKGGNYPIVFGFLLKRGQLQTENVCSAREQILHFKVDLLNKLRCHKNGFGVQTDLSLCNLVGNAVTGFKW